MSVFANPSSNDELVSSQIEVRCSINLLRKHGCLKEAFKGSNYYYIQVRESDETETKGGELLLDLIKDNDDTFHKL